MSDQNMTAVLLGDMMREHGPVKQVWSEPPPSGEWEENSSMTTLVVKWPDGTNRRFENFDLKNLKDIAGIAGIPQVAVKKTSKKLGIGRRLLIYENPHLVNLDMPGGPK